MWETFWMRFLAMVFVAIFGLSACIINETEGITTFVTVDGKAYKVTSWTVTRQVGLEEEDEYIQTVYVDGVGYNCSGDCALTVQRVLEETKRRKVITTLTPGATFSPIIPSAGSH